MNEKLFTLGTTAVFLVSIFISTSAHAAGNIEIRDIMHIEKVEVNSKGEKKIVLVEGQKAKVLPGEVTVSTIYYKNTGNEVVTKVALQGKVPDNTVYVNGSAKGSNSDITFSIDGGKSFSKPSKLKVVGPDGKEKKAKPEDYTHIRWVIDRSESGKEGHVLFRAKIE